jgi:hypothetical protein
VRCVPGVTRLPATVLALLALLALSHCRPAPAEDAGSPPAPDASVADAGLPDAWVPPTAADYCRETVGFFCPFYLRCGRILAATPEECRATFMESCLARYQSRYAALEAAGLLSLSVEGMRACASHLATVPCQRQLKDLDGPCGEMWVGHQPAGGPCGLDVESLVCAPGTSCSLGLDFCGECRPLALAGEPCGAEVSCGPQGTCQGGTCTARIPAGDSCADGGPCVVGATCQEGTCQGYAVVGEGEPCDQSHRCPYRSVCSSSRCVRTPLLGEPCTPAIPCASGRCGSPDGGPTLCLPVVPEGAPCTSLYDCATVSCTGGVCGAVPGRCFDLDGGT